MRHTPLPAERGIIYDRNGTKLAWNETDGTRSYIGTEGFAHVLGYIGFSDDENAKAHEKVGKSGAELFFNERLRGTSGIKIEEVDATGAVVSENTRLFAEAGEEITLSIDARVQEILYRSIKDLAVSRGFTGGSGAILDIHTGELLAITSYPEFNPNVLSAGTNTKAIQGYLTDSDKPFLDRSMLGLYTPGSTIKPFVALGALTERTISPEKEIVSTGSISVQSPFDPDVVTVFTDWKAHGWVNMYDAIAVSSNVYFYTIGGGYKDQKGIGIKNLEKYTRAFGFGTTTGYSVDEAYGTIPTPAWKEKHFPGEPWLLGDTYHTSIGQYGFLATPLQMVRAYAGIASRGTLVTPHLEKGHVGAAQPITGITDASYGVVHEGMRRGVAFGTAKSLNIPGVSVAAKTGTAELGVSKENVNSWVTGFFPANEPRYAFVLMMESGHRSNTVGASVGMKSVLEWMQLYTPHYLAQTD